MWLTSQPQNLYFNLTVFLNTTWIPLAFHSFIIATLLTIVLRSDIDSIPLSKYVSHFHDWWLVSSSHNNVLPVIHPPPSQVMPSKKFNPNLRNVASGDTLIISTTSHYTARGLVKKTNVSKQNLRPSMSPSKSPSKATNGLTPSISVEDSQNINFDNVLLEPLQLPKSKVRATHLALNTFLTFVFSRKTTIWGITYRKGNST